MTVFASKLCILFSLIALSRAFAIPFKRTTSTNTATGCTDTDDSSTISSVIDLQSQHIALSPVERMESIQKSCEELGIEKFDVYGDYTLDESSSSLRKFEAEIATDFGKEDAVFMPSGVMAQNIALLIHSQKEHQEQDETNILDNRFVCHHSSHLLLWEEESYSALVGMRAIEIEANTKSACEDNDAINGSPMSLQDVETVFSKEKAKLDDTSLSLGEAGLSSLIIELPHRELGGSLTPWMDVISIGELCKKNGVKYHCDGARIFEASAGYGKSLSELADPFDSFYISFYKGLGSISGAMLMGEKEFCDEARVWLRRFGGNLYTLLPYAVPSWAGYRRHVKGQGLSMSFLDKFNKLKRITEKIESDTDFSKVARFNPRIPETNMIHVYLKASSDRCERVRDKVFETTGFKIFTRIRSIAEDDHRYSSGYRTSFEWTIGEANGSIEDESFVHAWRQFISILSEK